MFGHRPDYTTVDQSLDPNKFECVIFQKKFGLVDGVRGSITLMDVCVLSDKELALRGCPIPHNLFFTSKDLPKDSHLKKPGLSPSERAQAKADRDAKVRNLRIENAKTTLCCYSIIEPTAITSELVAQFAVVVEELRKAVVTYVKEKLNEKFTDIIRTGKLNVPGWPEFQNPTDVRRYCNQASESKDALYLDKIKRHVECLLPPNSTQRQQMATSLMKHFGFYIHPQEVRTMQKKPENSSFYYILSDSYGNFANSYKRAGRIGRSNIGYTKNTPIETFLSNNNISSNTLTADPNPVAPNPVAMGNQLGASVNPFQQFLEQSMMMSRLQMAALGFSPNSMLPQTNSSFMLPPFGWPTNPIPGSTSSTSPGNAADALRNFFPFAGLSTQPTQNLPNEPSTTDPTNEAPTAEEDLDDSLLEGYGNLFEDDGMDILVSGYGPSNTIGTRLASESTSVPPVQIGRDVALAASGLAHMQKVAPIPLVSATSAQTIPTPPAPSASLSAVVQTSFVNPKDYSPFVAGASTLMNQPTQVDVVQTETTPVQATTTLLEQGPLCSALTEPAKELQNNVAAKELQNNVATPSPVTASAIDPASESTPTSSLPRFPSNARPSVANALALMATPTVEPTTEFISPTLAVDLAVGLKAQMIALQEKMDLLHKMQSIQEPNPASTIQEAHTSGPKINSDLPDPTKNQSIQEPHSTETTQEAQPTGPKINSDPPEPTQFPDLWPEGGGWSAKPKTNNTRNNLKRVSLPTQAKVSVKAKHKQTEAFVSVPDVNMATPIATTLKPTNTNKRKETASKPSKEARKNHRQKTVTAPSVLTGSGLTTGSTMSTTQSPMAQSVTKSGKGTLQKEDIQLLRDGISRPWGITAEPTTTIKNGDGWKVKKILAGSPAAASTLFVNMLIVAVNGVTPVYPSGLGAAMKDATDMILTVVYNPNKILLRKIEGRLYKCVRHCLQVEKWEAVEKPACKNLERNGEFNMTKCCGKPRDIGNPQGRRSCPNLGISILVLKEKGPNGVLFYSCPGCKIEDGYPSTIICWTCFEDNQKEETNKRLSRTSL